MLTADVGCDAMLAGLEEVLVSDPADLCLHRAYASSLLYHRNPAKSNLGRFIEAQLRLEDAALPAQERRKLDSRQRKLRKDFAHAWLGSLADWLLDHEGWRFELARGWLDCVEMPIFDQEFLSLLVRAPQARLLRRLIIHKIDANQMPSLALLREAVFFAHLEELQIESQSGRPAELLTLLGVEHS
jgi:hypothetical protein